MSHSELFKFISVVHDRAVPSGTFGWDEEGAEGSRSARREDGKEEGGERSVGHQVPLYVYPRAGVWQMAGQQTGSSERLD